MCSTSGLRSMKYNSFISCTACWSLYDKLKSSSKRIELLRLSYQMIQLLWLLPCHQFTILPKNVKARRLTQTKPTTCQIILLLLHFYLFIISCHFARCRFLYIYICYSTFGMTVLICVRLIKSTAYNILFILYRVSKCLFPNICPG